MIHTGIYDGHTPGPWKLDDRIKEMYLGLEPDVMLMEDAPLLLEEVKRLQEYNTALLHWVMYHLDKDENEVKEMIYE
tara:strand:- start:2464 stop:2694 length:231 start_codon:yes stop_codon:yes gene_type:complete